MQFQQYNFITKIILIVLLTISWNEFYSQKNYSIDEGKLRKSSRVGITYHLQNRKLKKKEKEELKTFRKEERNVRKAKRDHMKKLQTKETQKQMKDLLKSSRRINKHKPQYYIHEKIYRETLSGAKLYVIKSKFYIKNTFTNIKSIFVNKTSFDKKKKNNFIIEKN